ncbi:MAG: alpha-glucan family phosphorylase [Pseudodesulfovibrio sp.]|uniref:glycogen phosphorylase n=1 Tax=Pseudodesulfovibrio aespoeensis (strain ATCC 700646 / DSM 10631 / Aspo-2) TaxID=643562 RepID=E6VWU3_PSEA9|nr:MULTISPECIES: alpha-glucan family phosphorylase [Pseudodesulfovibrio]MBU4476359.1 alpha-glucan family phosphorylase [Pseudomonadota bacterium]ADU63705.1 alpha-glucan phosphorylase [Pseudodesulfovibrio aespoeensis Aspo-2]MBU4515447.1 alpha-glucan family phosphorylase [Pseudomonadota bacterium]MBU4522341.1 alpha-glucan family phosphorylase [Pseudomonadota bacterium]MBU4560367.1 alpha-glucan family phosphorylase [Pseudomonadota bacterium]
MESSWLFEVSWEVCNKVGGIHTVISSKAAEAMAAFDGRYVAIGPLLDRNPGFDPCDPPEEFAATLERLKQHNIPTSVGQWDIPGRPWVLLVDFQGAFPTHDKLLFQLWNDFGVDSMTGGWDYIEPLVFSTTAAMVIKEIHDDVEGVSEVFAHFHEWMSGAGVLYLKKQAPAVATLLTTHATMLGRAMSGSGVDIYERLEEIEPSQEAKAYGVAAKHSMESVAAREADCFATVSDITRREASNLLGTNPAVVTFNGFNLEGFAEPVAVEKTRKTARNRLIDLASRFLERDLKPDKTLLVATSGRYEFHNKGIDLLIESLAQVDGELAKADSDMTVVTFLLVTCGYAGFSEEARKRLKDEHYSIEKYGGIATHHLGDSDRDSIVLKCREMKLNNEPANRCCVIFIPVYLDGNDGILNLEYYDALAGMDLTVFPSFYEPWGYTPMESAAFYVPTITADRAGFGQWVMERHPGGHPGVMVLNRLRDNFRTAAGKLAKTLLDFTRWSPEERAFRRGEARRIAEEATWKNFYPLYIEAYELAAGIRTERVAGVQRMAMAPGKLFSFTGVNTTQPRLKSFSVITDLPDNLARLRDLASNLWWVWHRDAQEIFEGIDAQRWQQCGHNPVEFLNALDPERIAHVADDAAFMGRVKEVLARFDAYMAESGKADHGGITWSNPISYFSMEFGLHESIPIYSGGLGLLAGDHIKSASDLNLPFIGVSLLYKNGYFHQRINGNGEQVVEYHENNFASMPIIPLQNGDSDRVLVTVDLPGRPIYAQVWEVRVGRAKLYLLDTDVPENSRTDRDIAAKLYEPSSKGRIEQEILLGVGGVRMFKTLGITPCLYHLNEGHSAFLLFERIRQLMRLEGVDFATAKEIVRGSTCFTMHTPVPAGNERFERSLVENYFRGYAAEMDVPWDALWNLGHMYAEEADHLNMTVLALQLSYVRNGVSKLHGEVSRRMWMDLWRGFLFSEVPVGHITNGVHITTWLDERLRRDIEETCNISVHSALSDDIDWAGLDDIDDRRLWDTHIALKHRLYDEIRRSISNQWAREGEPPNRLRTFLDTLNPDHLTLCFARRFTAYKRPTLLFHNLNKVKELFRNPEKPINIIFAGKAHPADTIGSSFINLICRLAKQDDFLGRVIFLESYDIRLARLLVSGSDVWLNNPTRLMEASGTSGMKAALNGVPNCSILDGWWDEAFDTKNGWAVGQGLVYETQVNQDIVDADNLYAVLETEVVPEFYDRGDGVPHGWIKRMKESMKTAFKQYGTHRMVRDYISDMYLPTLALAARRNKNKYALAKDVGTWQRRIPGRFSTVNIKEIRVEGIHGDVFMLGNTLRISAKVDKGQLLQEEMLVELIVASPGEDTVLDCKPLKLKHTEGNNLEFRVEYTPASSGTCRYGIRVIPVHPGLGTKYETRLIRWS